jgi:hypothetical protein
MTPAPIALFTYNRLAHTRETVEALLKNELAAQSDLYVFSDGPRSDEDEAGVAAVRKYLGDISGFQSTRIVDQPRNLGLAQSIIAGVTDVCRRAGRVIVMEDDVITSPYFLRYMNEALEMYEHDSEVISVHGYLYPLRANLPETFFIRGADCWGWATWKHGWALFNPDGRSLLAELEARKLTDEFDFNNTFAYTDMLKKQIAGENNSWAIRWYASAFLQNKLTLYPGRSLVQNIGHDSTGEHCGETDDFDVRLVNRPVKLERLPRAENAVARLAIENYFRARRRPSFRQKLGGLFGRRKAV